MRASDRSRARRRGARGLAIVATPFALLGLASLVWQPSHAAFTDTTANPADPSTNTWSSGTVVLDDQLSGTLDWNETGLRPGTFGEICIQVTYSGTLAADVRLYVGPGDATGALGPYTHLIVQRGTGGGGGASVSCEGFTASESLHSGWLGDLVSTHTAFSSGLGSWAPSGTQTQTFRFYTQLRAGQEAQGLSGQTTFTWEARSS